MHVSGLRSPFKTDRVTLVIWDVFVLIASLWLAYQIRFDFNVPAETARTLPLVFLWVIALQVFWLWRSHQFEVLGYFTVPESPRLFWALVVPGFLAFAASTHFGARYAPPRSVVLADFGFSVIGLTAIRLVARGGDRTIARRDPGQPFKRARRAGIIGAGLVGTALAREFERRRELGLQAVAFFDDDRTKWGKRIHDILIVGAPEALLDEKTDLELEEVIIAMPSAPARRGREIAAILRRLQLKFSTVPSIYELTTGQAQVDQLRPVELKDLLGREQVRLGSEEIERALRGRVVMVTGAGGSIGSELCRQIASYAPSHLLLLEQSEVQLFQIERELNQGRWPSKIVPIIADLLDLPRLESIFQQFKVQVVFHAAAHKHVPIMELQPGEALKNNAFGTLQIAEICQAHQVERFVLISSDKAINPTNVMGATKRLAEICIQALYAARPESTRFMAVRFGNVLGSSGSVVPIFNRQIAAGGPVTVTHPEVTRYFMTIPEAAGLVLESGAQGSGGEIFLLDMGQPVRILDLARQLIELSGRDIRIEFTGLRPGEKLFEELCYAGENITPTSHPKIKRLVCAAPPLAQVRELLMELVRQSDIVDADELKHLLKCMVPEYQPQFSDTLKLPVAQATDSQMTAPSVSPKAKLLTSGRLAHA